MPGFLRVNHDNGQKANLPGRPFAGTSPFGSSVVEEFLSLLAHTLGSEQRKCAICPGMKEREVGGVPTRWEPAAGAPPQAASNGSIWEDRVFLSDLLLRKHLSHGRAHG